MPPKKKTKNVCNVDPTNHLNLMEQELTSRIEDLIRDRMDGLENTFKLRIGLLELLISNSLTL